MTVRQLAALLITCEQPHIKARDLAGILKVHRSTVTRAWDVLYMYGLVKRTRGENDYRDVHGSLTAKGVTFCNQFNGE